MLSVHYRNPVNFSREMIQQAESALTRLRTARERLGEAQRTDAKTPEDEAFLQELSTLQNRFNDALDDDLNTADAIGVLFDFARSANTYVSIPRCGAAIDKAIRLFDELTGVLGLSAKKAQAEFPAEALELLEARQAARKAKDFSQADALRDQLKGMGFVVEDTAQGPKLKKL